MKRINQMSIPNGILLAVVLIFVFLGTDYRFLDMSFKKAFISSGMFSAS